MARTRTGELSASMAVLGFVIDQPEADVKVIDFPRTADRGLDTRGVGS